MFVLTSDSCHRSDGMYCYHRKYLPILLMSSMHCEICGNCSIFLHFLLLPLLLSEPPEKRKNGRDRVVVTLTFRTKLTLSRFQINRICNDIFQFHEFQLDSFVCNPAIRADFDPFPLITPPGDGEIATAAHKLIRSTTHNTQKNRRAAH